MLRLLTRSLSVKKIRLKQTSAMYISSVRAYSSMPSIIAAPSLALVDQPVSIKVSGLRPHQMVTLVANTNVNNVGYESRAVYQANRTGQVDSTADTCLAGSFLGKDPMGLFWSLKPSIPNSRFRKKDVTTPYRVDIQVFDNIFEHGDLPSSPVTSTSVERLFMATNTTRIHVNEGRLRGTVFIPQGKGPFPAVLDIYGGLVSLIEGRAALLSSYGFVTLAFSYLNQQGADGNKTLVKGIPDTMDSLKEAAEWLCDQDYVDSNRLGLLGLSFGGYISLQLTALMPKVKAVVNVNGASHLAFCGQMSEYANKRSSLNPPWPDVNKIYLTDEGIVYRNAMDCEEPYFLEAWKHGAKVMLISGGDDMQINPEYHRMFYESVPPEFQGNVQYINYPGAGHLLEVPYIPYVRAVRPGRKRLLNIETIPEKYCDNAFLCGGYPQQHAYAQEDSWRKIKTFFKENL